MGRKPLVKLNQHILPVNYHTNSSLKEEDFEKKKFYLLIGHQRRGRDAF